MQKIQLINLQDCTPDKVTQRAACRVFLHKHGIAALHSLSVKCLYSMYLHPELRAEGPCEVLHGYLTN